MVLLYIWNPETSSSLVLILLEEIRLFFRSIDVFWNIFLKLFVGLCWYQWIVMILYLEKVFWFWCENWQYMLGDNILLLISIVFKNIHKLEQWEQLNFFPPCLLIIWIFKLLFQVAIWLHWGHLNFTPLCPTKDMCSQRSLIGGLIFELGHLNFNLSCLLWICVLKCPCWLDGWPQWGHWKFTLFMFAKDMSFQTSFMSWFLDIKISPQHAFEEYVPWNSHLYTL